MIVDIIEAYIAMCIPHMSPMQMKELYFWLAMMIACFIIEAVSTNFVSIWFGIGSMLNVITIACYPKVPLLIQCLIFLIVSGVTIGIFTPMLRKKLPRRQPLNTMDTIIGKEGFITDNDRVNIDGQSWRYKSDSPVFVGDKVKVVALNGVTLEVKSIYNKKGTK